MAALAPLALALAFVGGPAGAAVEVAASARGEGAFDEGEARVEARLLVHPDRDSEGGRALGVWLRMDPGWHVYGRVPGDSGLPTRLHWHAGQARVTPLPWPEPARFSEADGLLTTWGYAGEALLPARLDGAPPERLELEVEFLACRVECIPGRVRLAQELPVDWSALPADAPGRVRALLGGGATAPPPARPGLLAALGLALLGGLVLNLMPCVLPVLAIKVCAAAGLAGRSRRELWSHGLAYVTGVLLTLALLALLVVTLRAAGAAVGWGFQFQEPRFVVAIASVLLLFAMNLFGVFEITFSPSAVAELGAQAAGARRSFFEGLLAVVLATPCSAPFLGTATGFALTSPAPVVLAVFLCIGLGLAAPFLLVCAVPTWARFVPRPGPWMLRLRAGLGFALLATVVWLLWILGRSSGATAVAALLAFLWLLAFAAWTLQLLPQRLRLRVAVIALPWLVLLGLQLGDLEPAAARAEAGVLPGALPWRADAVGAAMTEGRTAFVYFTADWCITCKLNERRVLADPRVQRALDEGDVAVFRGDWTRRDEAIRAELLRHGKGGVPLYLVHHPTRPPLVLPELLDVERVLDALALPARLPSGSAEAR